MKNGKWAVPCFLIALTVLWIWRYVSLNREYAALQTGWDEFYYIGDEVSLSGNYIDIGVPVQEYSFQANSVQIVDTESYIAKNEIDLPSWAGSVPQRLVLVTATVRNSGDGEEGIPLNYFQLYGPDTEFVFYPELLAALNPSLGEDSIGVILAKDTTYDVVLPFRADRKDFGWYTWNHLDSYPLTMQLTYAPARILVKLVER